MTYNVIGDFSYIDDRMVYVFTHNYTYTNIISDVDSIAL